jgi:hypothetical protein
MVYHHFPIEKNGHQMDPNGAITHVFLTNHDKAIADYVSNVQ